MSSTAWKDPNKEGRGHSLTIPYKTIICLIIIGYVMAERYNHMIIEAKPDLSDFTIYNERKQDGNIDNVRFPWFVYADYDTFYRLLLIKRPANMNLEANKAEYLPEMVIELKKSLIVITPYKITLSSTPLLKVSPSDNGWEVSINWEKAGIKIPSKNKDGVFTIKIMEISSIDEDLDAHTINLTDVYDHDERYKQLVALGFSAEEVEIIRSHLKMGKYSVMRYEDWIAQNDNSLVDYRAEDVFMHYTVKDILCTPKIPKSQLDRFRLRLDLK